MRVSDTGVASPCSVCRLGPLAWPPLVRALPLPPYRALPSPWPGPARPPSSRPWRAPSPPAGTPGPAGSPRPWAPTRWRPPSPCPAHHGRRGQDLNLHCTSVAAWARRCGRAPAPPHLGDVDHGGRRAVHVGAGHAVDGLRRARGSMPRPPFVPPLCACARHPARVACTGAQGTRLGGVAHVDPVVHARLLNLEALAQHRHERGAGVAAHPQVRLCSRTRSQPSHEAPQQSAARTRKMAPQQPQRMTAQVLVRTVQHGRG